MILSYVLRRGYLRAALVSQCIIRTFVSSEGMFECGGLGASWVRPAFAEGTFGKRPEFTVALLIHLT